MATAVTVPVSHALHSRFVLDTDAHEQEHGGDQLPGYEQLELPSYERSLVAAPTARLRFRQVKAKLITIESLEDDQSRAYRIETRSSSHFLSSKPNMNLYSGASSDDKEPLAGFEFDNSSALPWVPRARVKINVQGGLVSKRIAMEAPNFADWKLLWAGRRFVWTLQDRPTSLALVDLSSFLTIARFTYSRYGTMATRSLEIGVLTIFAPPEYSMPNELVIGSCTIVVKYWARMGRHHRQTSLSAGRSASVSTTSCKDLLLTCD